MDDCAAQRLLVAIATVLFATYKKADVMSRVLTDGQIGPGDILLCFSRMTASELQAGDSGYSHAAIALGEQRVLEAAPSGVRIASVRSLLEEYDHIAVIRNSELWDKSRLEALEQFAVETVGKRFNALGLHRFPMRKDSYADNLMERVEGFFEGAEPEVSSLRNVYFCSELVTAAFIHVGIIAQSAAVVFTPETFSPSDIAKDKAFGFFEGYLKSHPDYKIPGGDFFKDSV
jgi:uncharacterized protein YycO